MSLNISDRIEALRQWLTNNNLDAVIIPHEDEYLGEYIPLHNERLAYISGFVGSAGAAIITQDQAAIFVDGRYTIQVTKQAPSDIFSYHHLIQQPPLQWASQNLKQGARLAIDPKMHSAVWFEKAEVQLSQQLQLISLDHNPIDVIWQDRPDPIESSMRLMDLELVGQSSADKRQQIADILVNDNLDAALLTQLDSVCWLLNIRGLDVSRLPVLLSQAIIHQNGSVDFFIDPSRVPDNFAQHVGANVRVHSPLQLETVLASLATKKVLVDPSTSNAWFSLILNKHKAIIHPAADPCLLPKACKNNVEAQGMINCHVRDGVAMSSFLCWLDKEVASGRLHDEDLLATKLQQCREQDPTLADLSFDTISAAGSNAAMCHYNHADQSEFGKLSLNSLYLVDSGGQYQDGTTDITRTIAIGTPSEFMKQQYTLVLKGHIALASARFPKGTTGSQLDVLARQFLWAKGYNYDHGTGHGVGHFLSVHEGPQRISPAYNGVALQAGMVVSNEPGYYRTDEFGIRIENLELINPVETNGDLELLGLHSLTRCPIDVRAINVDMLNRPELTWLNDYHQKVWDDLSPLVNSEVKIWLQHATQPLRYAD
ncbi:aminopeptidase P family protein [Vibrio sp. S11_S32]|uniref:aminopeptidase P family protein n=1 Tax=Vibrio sp. S11_S32 TaxID=2720225 RepID=UPI0016808ADF|nr:aminopeptidase P family protein [Vibrio sp. S11_S32]MBD1577279.1 aminopeptidase P family protein [Vibrio sp. S11_S32]